MARPAKKVYMARARPLSPRPVFIRHFARSLAIGGGTIGVGLAIGAFGYHLTEGTPWLDATLNAAMLLGGEGPIGTLKTDGGKVFATVYALFSGVVFITAVSVLLAPVLHRFLHRVHLDIAEDGGDDS